MRANVLAVEWVEGGRSRRYACSSGHRFTTLEIIVQRETVTTIHTAKNGVMSVSREGARVMIDRVMRAVEGALR